VNKSDGTNCAFTYPATNTPIPCPKGTIALTDNGQPLKDFPSGPQLNATQIAKLSNEGGLVEDANVQLTGGAHSILATYTSSDSNYQGSTSNALSVNYHAGADTHSGGRKRLWHNGDLSGAGEFAKQLDPGADGERAILQWQHVPGNGALHAERSCLRQWRLSGGRFVHGYTK